MPHVYRTFWRPSPDAIAALSAFSPATIHEAQGKTGALHSSIKPISSGLRLCGPALTVECHVGDNLMLFEAINLALPGDVLVVSAGNHTEQGGFGDVLAAACVGRKIAGVVIDAGVRDVRKLRETGLAIFSLGFCMKGTSKDGLGTINRPIMIGGQRISPGDIVCGDEDGVVVVTTDDFDALAKACRERDDEEEQLMALYRQGPMDIDDRIETMRSKGCRWSDDPAPRT